MRVDFPILARFTPQLVARRHARRRVSPFIICFSMLAACSAADGATTETTPTGSPTGSPTAPPSALVGKWRLTAAASGSVCDQLGHCTGTDGGSESYAFTADGHFEFTQYLETNLLGCRIVATLYAKGTITVSGASLTLAPTYAHQSKQANCESSFERDVTIDPTPYTWWTAKDGSGRAQLFIKGSTGTDGPFDLVP